MGVVGYIAVAKTELLVDAKTGRVRQAGADQDEGAYVLRFKEAAERSLYVFAKGVLGREYLSPKLHGGVCAWLQRCPPNRKLLLLPREHAKTTLVSHALPLHILIQSSESNLYFPGEDGADQRIILACETERRAMDHLRVIQTAYETNRLLRALWPHRCWQNPRRESKKWNDRELIVPRINEYPDPSIRAIGVDGAITGAHPTALLKDDLISLAAANSPAVMQTAIDWHIASRALINDPRKLEFVIGTRWAVSDLYAHIIQSDPTVEVLKRSVVEDGICIYPEKFSLEREAGKACIADLEKQFGVLYPLLYANAEADPSLTDFDMEMVRRFRLDADFVEFDEDERDAALMERGNAPAPSAQSMPLRGMPLNAETWPLLRGRDEYLRLRAR